MPYRYSVEFKEPAVRMVYQLREETGQDFGAIKRVAEQLGCGVESLRGWVVRRCPLTGRFSFRLGFRL